MNHLFAEAEGKRTVRDADKAAVEAAKKQVEEGMKRAEEAQKDEKHIIKVPKTPKESA